MDDATPFQPAPIENVIRLEEWAKVSEARMTRMEDKLDWIIKRLAATPTRTDVLVGLAVVFALLGIVFAGLGWLETRAARVSPAPAPVAPIVMQLPVAAALPVPARK